MLNQGITTAVFTSTNQIPHYSYSINYQTKQSLMYRDQNKWSPGRMVGFPTGTTVFSETKSNNNQCQQEWFVLTCRAYFIIMKLCFLTFTTLLHTLWLTVYIYVPDMSWFVPGHLSFQRPGENLCTSKHVFVVGQDGCVS